MDEANEPAPETTQEVTEPEEVPIAGIGTMVFDKWDASQVVCNDPGISRYVNLRMIGAPHTGGRHANAWFGKQDLSVTERFINNLMRTERYTGKKAQAYTVLKNSFEIINSKKKENPAQIMVRALENSAPRAAVVSLRYGGIRVYSGVDVSPTRRVDTAIRNICTGALESAKKQRSIENALSKELMLASEGNPDSYAVGKKEEIERQAEAAHN